MACDVVFVTRNRKNGTSVDPAAIVLGAGVEASRETVTPLVTDEPTMLNGALLLSVAPVILSTKRT